MKTLIETTDYSIKNWDEWKSVWDEVTRAEFRLSLLNIGFNVEISGREWAERILFYLQTADGWRDTPLRYRLNDKERGSQENALYPESSRRGNAYPWEIRQMMAHKAFEMLCRHVFRKSDSSEVTLFCTRDPEVLDATLDFFLQSREECGRYNLPAKDSQKNHHHDIAANFLDLLIRQYWDPSPRDDLRRSDDTPSWLYEAWSTLRLRFIELMAVLGKTRFLLDPSRFQSVEDGDLVFLERLILNKYPFPEHHLLPRTLETAVHLGCEPAQTLVLLRIMKAQEEKMRKVRDLKEKQRQTEEQLVKLRQG